MHHLEKTSYGFRVTIWEDLTSEEMSELIAEFGRIQPTLHEGFSVFLDLRGMISLDRESLEKLKECQRTVKESGCKRLAAVVESPVVYNQLKRSAVEAGSSDIERFIDASKAEGWIQIALDWITKGIEPPPSATSTQKIRTIS